MNLCRTLSSWGSSNYRPSAPFLYEVASHVKNCHSGHYYYYYYSYPWITPTVRNLQRKRDYVQAIKTRAPEHWHKFNQIRKQCKDSITTSHKTYLKEMFNEKDLKANPKPFWTYIKSLRKENQGIPTLQTPSGIPAATNISKANTLVNQFTSVFTKEITETTKPIDLTSTQCTQKCPKYHPG